MTENKSKKKQNTFYDQAENVIDWSVVLKKFEVIFGAKV